MNFEMFLLLFLFILFFVVFPLLILQTILAIVNQDQGLVSIENKIEYINSKLIKKKHNIENNNPFGVMAYSSPVLLPFVFMSSKSEEYVLLFENNTKCVVNKKQYDGVVEGHSYELKNHTEIKQYQYKWYSKPLLIKWFLSIEPDETETYSRFYLASTF